MQNLYFPSFILSFTPNLRQYREHCLLECCHDTLSDWLWSSRLYDDGYMIHDSCNLWRSSALMVQNGIAKNIWTNHAIWDVLIKCSLSLVCFLSFCASSKRLGCAVVFRTSRNLLIIGQRWLWSSPWLRPGLLKVTELGLSSYHILSKKYLFSFITIRVDKQFQRHGLFYLTYYRD